MINVSGHLRNERRTTGFADYSSLSTVVECRFSKQKITLRTVPQAESIISSYISTRGPDTII